MSTDQLERPEQRLAIRKKRTPPCKPFDCIYLRTRQFLAENPPACKPQALLTTLPKRWSIYPPLIILPPSAFGSPEWHHYLSTLSESQRNQLYEIWSTTLHSTHLALNAPIQDNVIRSPRITPLLGDFGSYVTIAATRDDFTKAFWVTATQTGIKQTWAPLYTMFSRGNITEKTRILDFPD